MKVYSVLDSFSIPSRVLTTKVSKNVVNRSAVLIKVQGGHISPCPLVTKTNNELVFILLLIGKEQNINTNALVKRQFW